MTAAGATVNEGTGLSKPYEVIKQAGSCGAIITGLDLREPLSDELYEMLHAELLVHLVICIRGQSEMSPDHQVAFASRWGVIEPHPYVEPVEGHPEMIRIYDPNPLTETWHADFTYNKKPPSISFLLGRTIPAYGGDTLFCNAYRVFEGLSDGLKQTLRGLRAFHEGTPLAMSKGLTLEQIQAVHPVVGRHPRDRPRAALRQRRLRQASGRLDGRARACHC